MLFNIIHNCFEKFCIDQASLQCKILNRKMKENSQTQSNFNFFRKYLI